MGRLTRRREQLEQELVAAGGDHEKLAELGTHLAEVTAGLEAAEERWLEIAAEAEAG